MGQGERPWLEIPAPEYMPRPDPEEYNPKTKKGDPNFDDPLDEEKRVIIIDL